MWDQSPKGCVSERNGARRARSSRPSSGTTASSLAWSARSSKHTRGRSSGSARGRATAGVSKTVQDNELKLAILALGQRVMDAIAERQRDEADLIGRYRDAVRKITETVEEVGLVPLALRDRVHHPLP